MSADARIRDQLVTLAIVCGLLTSAGVAQADDEEAPDLDFLEYLGSWEETDETWLILSAGMEGTEESDNKENVDGLEPAPNGENLAESDDEN